MTPESADVDQHPEEGGSKLCVILNHAENR